MDVTGKAFLLSFNKFSSETDTDLLSEAGRKLFYFFVTTQSKSSNSKGVFLLHLDQKLM
jgi:hypothetical protein